MSFLRTRSSVLRRRPLVVGTLTGQAPLPSQLRRAASPFVDLVELRLDTFPAVHAAEALSFSTDLIRKIRRFARKPLLLTLRSHTETGTVVPPAKRLSDAEREALLTPLLPLAALIDVEVRRGAYARRMTALAKGLGVDTIHSYHDFNGARLAGLNGWVARARALGADIVKVAVTPRREGELEAFLSWGLALRGPRVLIGMGPEAAISRTIGFTFGSILTFGHLGQAAAPGQSSALELGRAVRRIYGGGKGNA